MWSTKSVSMLEIRQILLSDAFGRKLTAVLTETEYIWENPNYIEGDLLAFNHL